MIEDIKYYGGLILFMFWIVLVLFGPPALMQMILMWMYPPLGYLGPVLGMVWGNYIIDEEVI